MARQQLIERISQIDWQALGNAHVKDFLQDAFSTDEEICRKGIINLKNAVAPWELLDGYGSSADLMKMSRSAVPEAVIPFLTDLLQEKAMNKKQMVLEILYDMARYEEVDRSFIPQKEAIRYKNWAKLIRHQIKGHIEIYEAFLDDTSTDVRQEAQALIRICNIDEDKE